MIFEDGFRLWFIVLYLVGIISFVGLVFRYRSNKHKIEKQVGPLPSPGIFVPLGIPLLILLTGIGELDYGLTALRWIGVVLSLYGLVLQFWTLRTLGHFALPGAGLYQDHKLVTSGPFRFVRHPLYSSGITLWLGAGLGTMNWLLLGLWPLILLLVIFVPIRQEESLLREKFGQAYEEYTLATGQIVPRP